LAGVHIRARDVVDGGRDELHEAIHVFWCNVGHAPVEVVKVLVEGVDVELDGDDFFCRGVGDAEGLLKAFEDPFGVAVGILYGKRTLDEQHFTVWLVGETHGFGTLCPIFMRRSIFVPQLVPLHVPENHGLLPP
jgi:hypothetical protein